MCTVHCETKAGQSDNSFTVVQPSPCLSSYHTFLFPSLSSASRRDTTLVIAVSIAQFAGGSFPSRVGVSLLRNAGPAHGALVVAGQREYEDLAVKLVSTPAGWKFLRKLRRLLLSQDDKGRGGYHPSKGKRGGSAHNTFAGAGLRNYLPLFDTETITTDLNRAFMLMSDVHDVWEDRGWRGEGMVEQGQRWRRLPHIVLTDKIIRGIRRGRRT